MSMEDRMLCVRKSQPYFARILSRMQMGLPLLNWILSQGVGLTAHLNHYDLIENPKMVVNFGHSLQSAGQFGGKSANMVISVSKEAETYLPEMEWICS